MTVESASYISQLDTTLPTAADIISEGDDHLRLTKTVLKTQFPNFGTTAIAASAAEVNYSVGVTSAIQAQLNTKAPTASPTFTGTAVLPATTSIGTVSDVEIATLDGVTSSIQTQIDGKGAIAGQAWTGAHSFAGATSVPTLAAGSNTTGAASAAFVQADFLQKFPNYTAPVNASTAELNYLVGLTGAIQPQLSNQVSGPIHAATAKSTPADADELGITDSAASWGLKKLTFANLKAWVGSFFVSKSGDTMTGPLAQAAGTAALPSYTFSGDTNTGMWSPAADVLAWSTAGAERLRIDTSGNVGVGTSSPTAKLDVRAGTIGLSTDNARSTSLGINRSDTGSVNGMASIAMFGSGTNSYLGNITFSTARVDAFAAVVVEAMRIDSSGNVLVTGGGGLGYGAGSGGTVTQATSKSTSVTLNKPSGLITTHNGSLAVSENVQFIVNNSLVTDKDIVVANQSTFALNTANYQISIAAVANGAFVISLTNISGISLSEAVPITFAIQKGAAS